MKQLPPEVIEYFRKEGKKGGRPATVQHKTAGYCRCSECRKLRGERGVMEEPEELIQEEIKPVSEMPRAVASKVVPKKQVAESNSDRLRRLREQKQDVESEFIDPERVAEVKNALCGSGSETGVLEDDLFVEPERELVKDPEDSGEEVRAERPKKVLPRKPKGKL